MYFVECVEIEPVMHHGRHRHCALVLFLGDSYLLLCVRLWESPLDLETAYLKLAPW